MAKTRYMLVLDGTGPTGRKWKVAKCPQGIDAKLREKHFDNYWLAWAEACRLNPPVSS
jgi:hypothetical protein